MGVVGLCFFGDLKMRARTSISITADAQTVTLSLRPLAVRLLAALLRPAGPRSLLALLLMAGAMQPLHAASCPVLVWSSQYFGVGKSGTASYACSGLDGTNGNGPVVGFPVPGTPTYPSSINQIGSCTSTNNGGAYGMAAAGGSSTCQYWPKCRTRFG